MEETRYRLGIAYLNWSRATARKLIDPPDYRLGRWYQKVGQSIEADAAFVMATKLKAARRETERSKLTQFEPRIDWTLR